MSGPWMSSTIMGSTIYEIYIYLHSQFAEEETDWKKGRNTPDISISISIDMLGTNELGIGPYRQRVSVI